MEQNNNIILENTEREIRVLYKNSAFVGRALKQPDALHLNTKVTLSKEIIEEAKIEGKSITVVVEDEERADLYTWRFRSKDIQSAEFEAEELDLSVGILDGNTFDAIKTVINKEPENCGIIIHMNGEKELPFPGSLSIYIGKQNGLKPGKSVYLYIANPVKNKLDCVVGGYSYELDDDGFISIPILLFADYVMLPSKAEEEIVRTLRKQITVKKEIELEVGAKKTIRVKLPKCLAIVEKLEDKTSSKAIGGVTVSFSSENKEVATVNPSTGRVKAVSEGETIITCNATIYSGKTKTLKTKIIVK